MLWALTSLLFLQTALNLLSELKPQRLSRVQLGGGIARPGYAPQWQSTELCSSAKARQRREWHRSGMVLIGEGKAVRCDGKAR